MNLDEVAKTAKILADLEGNYKDHKEKLYSLNLYLKQLKLRRDKGRVEKKIFVLDQAIALLEPAIKAAKINYQKALEDSASGAV
jgi:hypothetical protein